MKTPLAIALAALLIAPLSEAAVVQSAYTHLGGSSWLADFTIVNDGSPSTITNFTIDLPGIVNPVLLTSPATWDTLLVPPDPLLPDDGFLDSLAIDPADALAVGESLGGFRVQFEFSGLVPPSLPFVISDSSFTPLQSGTVSVTSITSIPEPTSVLLAALGLGLVATGARRARAQVAREEVAA